MQTMTRRVDGHEWQIAESGPADATTTVLLLPGGLCSVVALGPLIEALAQRRVRAIAATLPGFGRTAPLPELSMEAWARGAGELAAACGATTVAGHSLGANVAIEMVAGGHFRGPVTLLSPSFSAVDEDRGFRVLHGLGRVPGLGPLVWRAALKALPKAYGGSIPEPHRAALTADLANNAPAFCRRGVDMYFRYLSDHPDLVGRLCAAGVPVTVAFGDHKDVGLTDAERAGLEACAHATLVTVADATHMLVVEQTGAVADLIVGGGSDRTR